MSLTIVLRLNELLNIVLLVKYVENSARRVAILQLSCELMRKKVLPCLRFIVFQGSIENGSEIGRGARGGRDGIVRHSICLEDRAHTEGIW
jgi:hypothetical protein